MSITHVGYEPERSQKSGNAVGADLVLLSQENTRLKGELAVALAENARFKRVNDSYKQELDRLRPNPFGIKCL